MTIYTSWAMSSNRTAIQNKKQGSYCFTCKLNGKLIAALLFFCIVVLFEDIAHFCVPWMMLALYVNGVRITYRSVLNWPHNVLFCMLRWATKPWSTVYDATLYWNLRHKIDLYGMLPNEWHWVLLQSFDIDELEKRHYSLNPIIPVHPSLSIENTWLHKSIHRVRGNSGTNTIIYTLQTEMLTDF